MARFSFPLNDTQVALLNLSEKLSEEELHDLKQLIIAFKARHLALLANKVWDEKGWKQEKMQNFLEMHMRTPYKKSLQ
ncbi:MAG: hypothetical protein ABIO24_08060 [Saprospiraceae bacterium]